MGLRHAIVRSILLAVAAAGVFATASAARADDFQIVEVSAARSSNFADIKPNTIDFSDHTSPGAIDSETALTRFDEWAEKHPEQKKFLALFPAYTEPTVEKPTAGGAQGQKVTEKLYMYVAQARFVLDKAPSAVDLSQYVTLPFLEKIDPAIKHTLIAGADVTDVQGRSRHGQR